MNVLVYPVTLFDDAIYKKLMEEYKEKPTFWHLEDPAYFTRYKFNKKKLVLHRASMKKHQKSLRGDRKYVEFKKVKNVYSKFKNSKVVLFDPNDAKLLKTLVSKSKIHRFELLVYPSPGFILTTEEALEYGEGKKKYVNAQFYKMMRKKTGYLMTKRGTPEGGKWSFDTMNRKRLSPKISVPRIPCEKMDADVKEAASYVNKNFKSNYGCTEDFFYPTDRKEALSWLRNFISKRVKNFGPYQDFIAKDHDFLFHSVLSSSLNTGLLTPKEVCDAVIKAYKSKKTSLASCEGFVRQVISWREYVRMIYLTHGSKEPNFFGQRRKLNRKFYYGTTGITILDNEIKKAVRTAYSHHIVRLMLFANVMTMLGLKPDEMFKWFSELFIDAYDWVMWANVFGMGTYGDGGMTMSRPYISSSNYLKNMSDYKNEGEWREKLDALYYGFIGKHETKLRKIYATSSQVARYRKFSPTRKAEIRRESDRVFRMVF